MNKVVSVEWLRGVAAFGVCEMHLFCALDFFSKNDYFFNNYIFPISIAGRCGVSIFFVISGFIIPYSMLKNQYKIQNFLLFIIRRLTRLEPPYLFSLVLIISILALTAWINKTPFELDWKTVLLHLGYLNVFFGKPWLVGIYWTLAIEFQYYLLIALLFPLFFHSKSNIRYLTFFLVFILSFLASSYISSAFIFVHFPLFLLGISCALTKSGFMPKPIFVATVILLLIVIFVLHHKANTFFALLTTLIIFYDIDIKSSKLYFLGKISYSIYLFHWAVGVELLRKVYLYYYPASSEISKIIFCVFSIIFCLFFSWLTYEFIEKPSINLSKKVKYAS